MWICMSKSFLSIVADRNNKDRLLVRARIAGHIEAIFPEATVIEGKGTDYLYRAFVSRAEVVKVIAENVEDINYDNFKNSVKNRAYHDALFGFWTIMFKLQERFASKK